MRQLGRGRRGVRKKLASDPWLEFAYRVAWQCGRIFDVELMLREVTPEQLMRAKIAYERIPLPDPWRQTDILAGVVQDDGLLARYAAAGETPPADLFHTAGDFIPRVRVEDEELVVNQTAIDDYQASLEAQFGGGR